MKKQLQLALAGAAIGLASLLVVTPRATAQVSFPKIARGINTWMSRAYDVCSPTTVSVTSPNVPSTGCSAANGGTTDANLTMKSAKLRVTNQGRIALFGTGFTLGDELRVRLTLRVTKPGVNKKHPPAPATVTFADTTVDCPASPDAFNARPNGAVIGTTTLSACLSPNTGLANGNIEIIDVSLVNALTGKIVAVPGVLR
jgi:hypothetical protein